MERELAQTIGVMIIIIPLLIWSANALGFNVSLPEQHFATLIWAGVSLILGYNAKTAFESGGSMLKKSGGDNDDK